MTDLFKVSSSSPPRRLAYTLREVAEATGQSVSTLKIHITAGRLRTVRPGGGPRGRLLVRAEDLASYLSAEPAEGGE